MRKRLSTDAVIILSIVLFAAAMFVMKMRSIANEKNYDEQTLTGEYDNGGVAYLLSMTEGQLTYGVLMLGEAYRITDSSGKWRENDGSPADYTGYVRFQDEDTELKHFVPIKHRGALTIVEVNGNLIEAPGAFILPDGATNLQAGRFDLERYPQLAKVAAVFATEHAQPRSDKASPTSGD